MSQPLSLPGCTPEPLGNYLKALGVFRLIAEQADPNARAWWKGGTFHLHSRFANSAELVTWLCEQYEPSPLIAPWSVNSGSWPPDKQPPSKGDKRGTPNRSLRQLCSGEHGRFQRLEITLRNFLESFGGNSKLADEESKLSAGLRSLLDELEKATKKGPTRARLIRQLRNCVNEPDAVRWLDAIGTSSRQQDEAAFLFPLLAEAGSEGVNSFVGNFYGRLCDHLPVNVPPSEFWSSEQGQLSTARLKSALFGDVFAQAREKDAAGGLYFPGLVEAPNVGQKFVSTPKKRANPWEFILAME